MKIHFFCITNFVKEKKTHYGWIIAVQVHSSFTKIGCNSIPFKSVFFDSCHFLKILKTLDHENLYKQTLIFSTCFEQVQYLISINPSQIPDIIFVHFVFITKFNKRFGFTIITKETKHYTIYIYLLHYITYFYKFKLFCK